MENQKEYYVERIKQLEKRKRMLRTDFFNAKIAEYESKLAEIENNEKSNSTNQNNS